MLTEQDNELLCQVGPGTPMGMLLREYWHPVRLSTDLPAPNCDPLRVRLLGEDLIAFRDSSRASGHVGQPLRASGRLAGLRAKRGERPPLRLPRLEVRCQRSIVDMPNEPEFRYLLVHQPVPVPYYTMPPGHAVVDRHTPKSGGGGHASHPVSIRRTLTSRAPAASSFPNRRHGSILRMSCAGWIRWLPSPGARTDPRVRGPWGAKPPSVFLSPLPSQGEGVGGRGEETNG